MKLRSMLRWAVRVLGVLLVVGLAVSALLRIAGHHHLTAAERALAEAIGPHDPSWFASPNVADEENAALVLRAGSEAVLVTENERRQAAQMALKPPSSWTDDQLKFIRGLLVRNRPAFELLHRAAGMKKSGFGLVDPASLEEDLKVKLPLLKLLWGQRFLWLDAQVALRDSDQARFQSDAQTMGVMAAALEREAPLISELVGIAAEKMLLQVISDAVARPDVDTTTLAVLEAAIPDPDLRRSWRRSHAYEFNLVRVAGSVQKASDAQQSLGARLVYLAAPAYFDAPYVEWEAHLLGAVDLPYGTGLVALTEQRARSAFSPLDVRIPNLTRAAGRYQVILSERRLARLALALRREIQSSGEYPASLSAFEAARAADPFTGEQLAYARRLDGSAQLSVPGGIKCWNRLQPDISFAGPFTWELPAPDKGAPGRK